MIPRLTTRTVSGQRTYNFGFDYLSKDFIKVEINGTLLEYPKDYSVEGKSINLVVAPTEESSITIYRDTSTMPLVEWKDSSIMTAKDMNLQQKQTQHLSEELDYSAKTAKETYKKSTEVNQTVLDKAEEVATKAREVEDNKAVVVAQAEQVARNTQSVETNTSTTEFAKNSTETMLQEIKSAHVDTLEKARSVQKNTESVTTNTTKVAGLVEQAKDALEQARAIAGGDFYSRAEVDQKIQQQATEAISNLIGTAPEAMDTIQELAQALGNDPNFATTITNLVGTKTTLQQVYPVGAIYMSTVATSPKTLFGFGEWQAIEGGRVLLAHGGKYNANTVGGSETHTLTVEQMPNHNHSGSSNRSGGHSHSGSTNTAGGHSHGVQEAPTRGEGGKATRSTITTYRYDNRYSGFGQYGELIENQGNHTHSVNINQAGDHSHGIPNQGGGQSFSIMQPYLVVYIWKRVS